MLFIFVPLLHHLSIRTRVSIGLPLLVTGIALILASGALVALFTPGAVLGLAGAILTVSALLRRPRPGRPARAQGRARENADQHATL